MTDGYGSFGAQAQAYGAARVALPEALFDYLEERRGQRTHVLDMGCGTGIPSRQMADRGLQVTGSDRDGRMIEQARRDSAGYDIEYVVALANKQSFEDGTFEIITIFSAFHWFTDDASLAEVRRLLCKEGLFFVVNKNETGDMKMDIHRTLVPYIAEETFPADAKAAYDPALIMTRHGFVDVQEYAIATTETYTIDQAVLYTQSMSIWNLVREEQRSEALEALRDLFISKAVSGLIQRPLEVKAVSGYKG